MELAQSNPGKSFTGAEGEVKLMILDPGHFHAALVQKTMYSQVSPVVWVYAPAGPDLDDHLQRIEGFNTRPQQPTSWQQKVHADPDYLEFMLKERPGNVVVTAGNNRKKPHYIKAVVDARIHVLSDKPMCIDLAGWEILKAAFASAAKNNVLLYDVMTERHEITTMLQKELVNIPALFGELQKGTPEDPAVTKESVHFLFKYVAGKPICRPPWYLDVGQQGDGIVDVSTHLVDLVMWECFPGQTIDYLKDIRMVRARRWPTMVTRSQFEQVTRVPQFPDYLSSQLDQKGDLPCYCNGEMVYTLKGVHVKISVIWNFQSNAGAGDTHYSTMRGTRANVVIEQGEAQRFRPELYVEPASGVPLDHCGQILADALKKLQGRFRGISAKMDGSRWHVVIPDEYYVGHEAHFGQVTEKYLRYLVEGKLPDWEVPNMIAKYFTTTQALELARKSH